MSYALLANKVIANNAKLGGDVVKAIDTVEFMACLNKNSVAVNIDIPHLSTSFRQF